jgi:hypothetical protein
MPGLGNEQQVFRVPLASHLLDEGEHTVRQCHSPTLPLLVTFKPTPSGAARCTISKGRGTSTKSRTRMARSSDHRSPVHAATSKTSARRLFRALASDQTSSSCSSVNGCISTGGVLSLRLQSLRR